VKEPHGARTEAGGDDAGEARQVPLDDVRAALRGRREAHAAEAGVPLEEFYQVAEDMNRRKIIGRFSTFLEHVKPLKDGDIVNIDVTLILDGWHGDSSRMFTIGEIPRRAERLMEVTHEAMMRGIAAIRPGATSGDIGHAIQTYVEAQHMSVVRDFCGHGLGQLFHDEPNIVHVGRPGEGIVLKPGMFFTVEPMINLGRPHVKVLSDGWTAVTRDRSLSAQFEHTIGVTKDGVEVFTFSPAGLHKPPYKR